LYYEGEQKPSAADEKTFIMRNLITDYVNRQVSKLVAGEIQPSYVGGNELTDAAKELVGKMLEYNQFSEFGIEYFGNLFEIEGLAGWKFSFDPYEISPFGLGTPRIDVLGPGEILLDPNNPNPFNYKEDIIRIFKTRMTLDEAQARWYLKKDELTSLSDENSGNETTKWVDIYEVEHKVMTYYPAALSEDPAFANVKEAKVPDYIKKKYTGNGKYKLLDKRFSRIERSNFRSESRCFSQPRSLIKWSSLKTRSRTVMVDSLSSRHSMSLDLNTENIRHQISGCSETLRTRSIFFYLF